jgi:DNA-binding NtrC family response regulator
VALSTSFAGRAGGTKDDEFVIPPAGFNLEEHEKSLLLQALDRSRNNKSQAAKLLGISRATLRYRLDKFNISTTQPDESARCASHGE